MTIKNVLFLTLMTLYAACLSGQCQKIKYPFYEASAGVGVIPTFVKDQIQTELPPFSAGLDYRINERFSLGTRLGYTRVLSAADLMGDGDYEQFRNNFFMAGLRFAVHSRYFEKWDLYGGMNLAYTISKVDVIEGNVALLKKHLNYKPVRGSMMASAFLGAKFILKSHTCLFGEVGYGISLLSVGVSRKF